MQRRCAAGALAMSETTCRRRTQDLTVVCQGGPIERAVDRLPCTRTRERTRTRTRERDW